MSSVTSSFPVVTLGEIFSPIADDMDQVTHHIETQLCSHVPLITEMAQYLIHAGGKRIRPALLIMVARALGCRDATPTLLAAVIELIHTATLLHDDVVDQSRLRRGSTTANIRWSDQSSVLVGDYLYSRSFQMMVKAGSSDALNILADCTNKVAVGEVEQLVQQRDPGITEASYLRVVSCKTAALFSSATEIGAIMAKTDMDVKQSMAELGDCIGVAYQLIDDALDYSSITSSTFGKNIGDDFSEGKITLPLLYAYQHCSSEESALLQSSLQVNSTIPFQKVYDVIVSAGGITYTLDLAQKKLQQAAAIIADLPNSQYRNSLDMLLRFLQTRSN